MTRKKSYILPQTDTVKVITSRTISVTPGVGMFGDGDSPDGAPFRFAY